MIYLKDFVLKIAKEKELTLLDRTIGFVKSIEIEMNKNRKEIDPVMVMSKLQRIQELHKEFAGNDWTVIEKEIGKMN